GKNVLGGQAGKARAAIDQSADDGVALKVAAAMRVFVNRVRVGKAARKRTDLRSIMILFVERPAAILSTRDGINAFVSILPDVAAPHFTRLRIKGKTPRIAQTDGVKFGEDRTRSHRRAVETR